MEEQDRFAILKKYLKTIEIAFWIGIIGIPLISWLVPLSAPDYQKLLILAIVTAIFTLIFFHWIIPYYSDRVWINYLGITCAIGIIAYLSYLLEPYDIHTEILYVIAIVSMAVIAGSRIAYHAAVLSIVAQILITIIGNDLNASVFLSLSLHVLVLAMAGFAAGSLIGTIHKKAAITDRKFRYFSTLLRASMLASQKGDLELTLSQVAEMITRDVPVTACRIALLDGEGHKITTFGAYPIRKILGWQPDTGKTYPLDELPKINHVLQSGQPMILQREDIETIKLTEYNSIIFFSGVQTVCLFPLITQGKRLGILSVGEIRQWTREPFDLDKIELLKSLANQTAAMIQNAQLFYEAQRQAERMEMLNEVARTIGSTIELEKLLELIYQQVSKVLPSDTYFVSLYDPEENIQDIRVLIDEGVRYPAKKIPVGDGLSSWVTVNRQPLLVRHLTKDINTIPNKPIIVGQDRPSESWLGVPMLAGDEFLGMVAIGSYSPNAFDESDVELLSNVASQATLAIYNARHHAEVEEQARRDSLTHAYNHGYFLRRLDEEVGQAKISGQPVSLIMLDIDYFKEYNDSYGHVIGDDVLRKLVQAIQSHLDKGDILGRWGGEEFGIALPGKTLKQALQVAENVRRSLAAIEVETKDGDAIPVPTASQGISTFPTFAQNAAELVDTSDRALYRAKGLGRDQVVAHKPQDRHQVEAN